MGEQPLTAGCVEIGGYQLLRFQCQQQFIPPGIPAHQDREGLRPQAWHQRTRVGEQDCWNPGGLQSAHRFECRRLQLGGMLGRQDLRKERQIVIVLTEHSHGSNPLGDRSVQIGSHPSGRTKDRFQT